LEETKGPNQASNQKRALRIAKKKKAQIPARKKKKKPGGGKSVEREEPRNISRGLSKMAGGGK